MTIAFISDLHLSADRPESIALFQDFMHKSACLLDKLYILGDFFDYWIGDDATEVLGFGDVEAALARTIKAGTPVTFLAGNRDFLVGEAFCERTGLRMIEDQTVVEIEGQRVLLSHGDVFCTDDAGHMAARRTLLDKSWQADFLSQTIDQRLQFAQALRQQSELEKANKSMEIMDVNQAAVSHAISIHNADLLIHGHTHKPYVHRLTVADKEVRRYVLGDWYDDRSVLYANQGKYCLKK